MRLEISRHRKQAILVFAAVALLALPSVSAAIVSSITASAASASAPTGTLHDAAVKKGSSIHHASQSGLLAVVDQPDILPNQRQIADDTLRSLPPQCRDNLRSFYVNYEPNPKNRGLGGADTIIIAGQVPNDEFRALLIHECGHVTDLGGFRGTPSAGMTAFFDGNEPIYANDPSVAFYAISWNSANERKGGATKGDFVSGYAMTDPFEDFAESFAFYVLQKKEFARLAKKGGALAAKYQWFETYLAPSLPKAVAQGKFTRGAKEPWDVTKLPYVWVN